MLSRPRQQRIQDHSRSNRGDSPASIHIGGVIEPVMSVVMGVIVPLIVLAILLPIIESNQLVR
jgi:hypothetical protein